MPITIHVRLPLDEREHEELVRMAGDVGIAAFLRKLVGFAPRRPGRPRRARNDARRPAK